MTLSRRTPLGPGAKSLARRSTFAAERTSLKRSRSRKQRAVPTAPALHCWLATLPGAGPCDGKLDRCHLISKQLLRREIGEHVVWHPAVWVGGCRGHHGALDVARTLRVPRSALPVELERFAVEHGLVWALEREYGAVVA